MRGLGEFAKALLNKTRNETTLEELIAELGYRRVGTKSSESVFEAPIKRA